MERSSRLRIGTLDSIRSLPPRCSRKVRSLTGPTLTPGIARSASTISVACASPRVAQVTSTEMWSECDAVTSRPVTIPPVCSMAVVSSLTAVGRATTSRRTVMDEDTLGAEVIRSD